MLQSLDHILWRGIRGDDAEINVAAPESKCPTGQRPVQIEPDEMVGECGPRAL